MAAGLFDTETVLRAVRGIVVPPVVTAPVVTITASGAGGPDDNPATALVYEIKVDGVLTGTVDLTFLEDLPGVLASLFDAQTILRATTNDTPSALTVGEQTVVGRITGGNIEALTVAQLKTLLGGIGTIATAALTDYVPVTLYDANTVLAATTDNTPAVLTVAASTFVGRKSTGNIAAMTVAEAKTELGMGTMAAMVATDYIDKALYDANSILAATTDNTPAVLAVAASTFVGRKASGGIAAMTVAEATTLLGLGTISTFASSAYELTGVAAAADKLATGNRYTANATLALGDAGAEIEMNMAGANTVTFPQNSSVAIPVGSVGTILQYGAGTTTIVQGTGATINKRSGLSLVMNGQWSVVSWRKTDTNTFVISGDLV